MFPTSSTYNSIISGVHHFEVRVSVAGTFYGMDAVTSLRTRRAAFGDGSPTPGLAPAGEITLSLFADSSSVPRTAELRPYVRAVNDDGDQSEWIPKGVYYVDTREADPETGILTLCGYDTMLKGECAYPSTSHAWPYTDLYVVREIASFLGVSVDARTTALMTSGFQVPLPADYTVRETLGHIAALYGGSFVLTDSNTLLLVCLWDRKSSADTTLRSVHGLRVSPAFPACSGVRFLLDDDTELTAGNSTGYVYEIACPFATQAAANALLNRMRDFVYRPYTAEKVVLDPAADLGDTVTVNRVLSSLFSCELFFDSLCAADAAAPEDEELDHEYPYASVTDRTYSRKLKQAESRFSVRFDEISAEVSDEVEGLQSQLTVQAGQIASKVSQTDYDSQITQYNSQFTQLGSQISAKVSKSGGTISSFAWYLDTDMFRLVADGLEVMRVDRDGLTVQGLVNATAGNIGGCVIENGTLKIANANITNLNASKITAGTLAVARLAAKSIEGVKIADYTLTSTKIDDGAAVNRVIGVNAVSYAKTSFQTTLDQVGTNKANIDTINGYFTGSAQFNSLLASSFALNSHYLGLETITIGGVNRKVVTWT